MFQEEEVRRGMALLDEKVPGWDSRIDPNSLDVGSYFFCPLGQLFRSFGRGMDALRVPDAVEYGFMTPGSPSVLPMVLVVEDEAALEENTQRMNETWRSLLADRLASPV